MLSPLPESRWVTDKRVRRQVGGTSIVDIMLSTTAEGGRRDSRLELVNATPKGWQILHVLPKVNEIPSNLIGPCGCGILSCTFVSDFIGQASTLFLLITLFVDASTPMSLIISIE